MASTAALTLSRRRQKHSYDRAAGAVSTDRRHTGFKLLGRSIVLQGLSGSLVELAGDCAEFGLAIG